MSSGLRLRSAGTQGNGQLEHVTRLLLAGFAATSIFLFGCQPSKSTNLGPTGPHTPILPEIAFDVSPEWSPDGRHMAYMHIARNTQELSNGQYQIWLYDWADSSAHFVAPGDYPGWSPHGDSLLFIQGGTVVTYGLTSGAITTLLALGDIDAVSWSPTAPILAVATTYTQPSSTRRIWLASLTGGAPKNISTLDYSGAWLQPVFSPAGDRILHVRCIRGIAGTELFTMDTTGTSAIRLTNNQREDIDPAWSRDGTRIAFDRDTDTEGPELWVANADGTAPHPILGNAKEASWSPDGARIVVTRFTSPVSLWTVNPDGTNAMPVPGLP